MFKTLLGVFLSFWLVVGLSVGARAAPMYLGGPVHLPGSAVTPVASVTIEGGDEFLHFDAPRLLFLGAGVVGGVLLLSPAFGIGDLLGAVAGVVGAEVLYHGVYKKSGHVF